MLLISFLAVLPGRMTGCSSIRALCAERSNTDPLLDEDSIRELVLRTMRSAVAKLVANNAYHRNESSLDRAAVLQFVVDLVPTSAGRLPWDGGSFFKVLTQWIQGMTAGASS